MIIGTTRYRISIPRYGLSFSSFVRRELFPATQPTRKSRGACRSVFSISMIHLIRTLPWIQISTSFVRSQDQMPVSCSVATWPQWISEGSFAEFRFQRWCLPGGSIALGSHVTPCSSKLSCPRPSLSCSRNPATFRFLRSRSYMTPQCMPFLASKLRPSNRLP